MRLAAAVVTAPTRRYSGIIRNTAPMTLPVAAIAACGSACPALAWTACMSLIAEPARAAKKARMPTASATTTTYQTSSVAGRFLSPFRPAKAAPVIEISDMVLPLSRLGRRLEYVLGPACDVAVDVGG